MNLGETWCDIGKGLGRFPGCCDFRGSVLCGEWRAACGVALGSLGEGDEVVTGKVFERGEDAGELRADGVAQDVGEP